MTYTILFVIALICVSGFIAYFGDVLGRRMGKKRLTLFNLRPRHTAIVVTTITGMIISSLALATLFSVNSQFRKVLLRGEQILTQNKQLSSANIDLAKRSQQLRLQVARQKQELAKAQQDAVLAKKQRDNAVQRVASLRREIATRQQELAELRKQKSIAQSELDLRRADLRLAQVELRNAETKLSSAQSELATAQQQLGAAKAELEKTQDLLKEANATGEDAADLALDLRLKDLAFRQGDELARGVINPAKSNLELRRDIHTLLEQASQKALEAHAKIGSNGRAVNVRYRQLADKSHMLIITDEPTCVAMAVDKIESSNDDVLVQVICGTNALPSEQVPVELRLFMNELVYSSGDKIGDTKIDGRESEGYILLALNSFLQSGIAKTAVQAGLIPIPGQDSKTDLGSNRQAQADELLKIVAKIKAMNAVANVTVYATAAIHASDSLNMDNIRLAVDKVE